MIPTQTVIKENSSIYTWQGVMQFLNDQQKIISQKETEWMVEKYELESKIKIIEAESKAQENINEDLVKRIKMLEYALRVERLKYAKLCSNSNIPIPEFPTIDPNAFKSKEEDELSTFNKVNKENLVKFLNELGLPNIYEIEEEVKSIINDKKFGENEGEEIIDRIDKDKDKILSNVKSENVFISRVILKKMKQN